MQLKKKWEKKKLLSVTLEKKEGILHKKQKKNE